MPSDVAGARAKSRRPLPRERLLKAADERGWLRDFLRELAAAAGAPDPGLLASQIHLLYDGAMLAASLDGNAGITAASRTAAEALLDAALASRASGRHRKEPVAVG